MNSCHLWYVSLLAAPACPYAHAFPAAFHFIVSGTPELPSGGPVPMNLREASEISSTAKLCNASD